MVQRVVRSRRLPLTHIPPPRLCPINAKDPGVPKCDIYFMQRFKIHNFKPFREQPWSSEVIGGQQRFSQVSTQLPNCSFIHSCTFFVLFKILKNKDLTKRIKKYLFAGFLVASYDTCVGWTWVISIFSP